MASIDSIEPDKEVSTPSISDMAFYERETELLTEEKDKFYREYTSLLESQRKEKSVLNVKITSLEKSLIHKTTEVRNILH